jgi:hypothetical protein
MRKLTMTRDLTLNVIESLEAQKLQLVLEDSTRRTGQKPVSSNLNIAGDAKCLDSDEGIPTPTSLMPSDLETINKEIARLQNIVTRERNVLGPGVGNDSAEDLKRLVSMCSAIFHDIKISGIPQVSQQTGSSRSKARLENEMKRRKIALRALDYKESPQVAKQFQDRRSSTLSMGSMSSDDTLRGSGYRRASVASSVSSRQQRDSLGRTYLTFSKSATV